MVAQVRIENMVSAITLDATIDLRSLVSKVKGIEYNPESFPGAVFRIREPKLAMLLFSSGKVICTGAKRLEDVDEAIVQLLEKLRQGGIQVKGKPRVQVQNIVASASLGVKVNLDKLAIECYNTEYAPEQFPGLVYRLQEPKTVMLVFRSGKIIITGAKNPEDALKSAQQTESLVREYSATID
jgi:transcription initiation factor TFIID TATA-box-binding protein